MFHTHLSYADLADRSLGLHVNGIVMTPVDNLKDKLYTCFRMVFSILALGYAIDDTPVSQSGEFPSASATDDYSSKDEEVPPVDTSSIPVNTSHMTAAELHELVGRLRSGTGIYPVVTDENCTAAVKGDLSSPADASPGPANLAGGTVLSEGVMSDSSSTEHVLQCPDR